MLPEHGVKRQPDVDFAQNVGPDSEFTGVTFSLNGHAMLFNIQTPGRTSMVWGPFGKIPC